MAGASKKEGTDSVTAKAWTTAKGRRGRVGPRKGTTPDHPPAKGRREDEKGKTRKCNKFDRWARRS